MNHLRDAHCCSPDDKKQKWYKNKNLLTLLVLAAFWGLSTVWPALAPMKNSLKMYLQMVWWAVLIGFLLGGLLDRYVPKEYISSILAKKKKRSILYAVTLGFLMSACCHGILALSMELYKKGASTPVVVAFLLASPWANLPITLMLLSFFGLKAFYIILGALIIAITTGLSFQFLERHRMIESNPNTLQIHEDYSISKDIQRRVRERKRITLQAFKNDTLAIMRGALSLADMTLWWIVIGVILSAAAGAFIPEDLFRRYMGPTLPGLFATLALATAIEVCSEGTAPLAFQIFIQTGAFGNAFVFLMAGVATDLTEIGLVWANIGRKTALWMPGIVVPQVVLLGILANRLF